mgnify:CR=1 FL=1
MNEVFITVLLQITVNPNSVMSSAIVRSFRRPQKGLEMRGSPACDLSCRPIDCKASTEALQCQCQTSVELRQRILGKRARGSHNNMLGPWNMAEGSLYCPMTPEYSTTCIIMDCSGPRAVHCPMNPNLGRTTSVVPPADGQSPKPVKQ